MPETGETLYRELYLERASIDKETRTVDLSFCSEQPVIRSNWWGDNWTEVLGHEPGNADLTRLSQMGVLLFNHNSDMPMGQVQKPMMDCEQHKCMATVSFDSDPESERIYQKVLNGTLKGVSVGYRVHVWEEVKAGQASTCGRFTGPVSIARKWEPFEISIVSVPADSSVGVGRTLNDQGFKEALKRLIEEAVVTRRNGEPPVQTESTPTPENIPDLSHYYRRLSTY